MVANIFGKIYAKLGKLEAQNKVSRITRQIARMTKEIGRAEKQHNAMKRAAINDAKMMNNSVFGMAGLMQMMPKDADFASIFKSDGSLDYAKAATDEGKALYSSYQQWMTQQQTFAQNNLNHTLAMIEDQFDARYELEIQAMKDEQADLEIEKETAQAEVQVYEGMEKQEGEFAKNNIQNMFG